MKILKLTYQDQQYHWKLDTVEFLPNLNLLVGVSGAGKTQIIRSFISLINIVNGESIDGLEWDIYFKTTDQFLYQWKGKFETRQTIKFTQNDSKEEVYKILYEYLYKNEEEIVKRTEEGIFYKNCKTPKLSPFKSVVELLSEEKDISRVKKEFRKIRLTEPEKYYQHTWGFPVSLLQEYENYSLSEIKESRLPTPIKLLLLYKDQPVTFNKIKKIFTEIFTNIEDIKIAKRFDDDEKTSSLYLNSLLKEDTVLKIKQKGVDTWIRQPYISSGMLKTLMYISELYLSPDESVILIDEFENGLGVNCIDSVTDLILENKNLQFIITSHHPYIINNINPAYWKIVTRRGSVISVKTAEDFHISHTQQKAFIDLINILEDESNEIEEE